MPRIRKAAKSPRRDDFEVVSVNNGEDVWDINYGAGIAGYRESDSVKGDGSITHFTESGIKIKALHDDISSYLEKKGYTPYEDDSQSIKFERSKDIPTLNWSEKEIEYGIEEGWLEVTNNPHVYKHYDVSGNYQGLVKRKN